MFTVCIFGVEVQVFNRGKICFVWPRFVESLIYAARPPDPEKISAAVIFLSWPHFRLDAEHPRPISLAARSSIVKALDGSNGSLRRIGRMAVSESDQKGCLRTNHVEGILGSSKPRKWRRFSCKSHPHCPLRSQSASFQANFKGTVLNFQLCWIIDWTTVGNPIQINLGWNFLFIALQVGVK